MDNFNLIKYVFQLMRESNGVYSLEERSGDIIYDVSGNGEHINLRKVLVELYRLSDIEVESYILQFWNLTNI